MKALDWERFFAEQRARYGKVVFSVAELANSAQTTLHIVNTELARLRARGVVVRYAHGCYGPPQGVTTEAILPAVDPGAYITGFYGLFRHHLVTQAPAEVTCFTNRRHNRKAVRMTPAGSLRFICVPSGVYKKPQDQAFAPPEQALCDFAWLNVREDLNPQSLVTFQNLDTLNLRRLNKTLQRYPENVRRMIAGLIGAARPKTRALLKCRHKEGCNQRSRSQQT
jgi:hypothetical protein